MTYDFDKQLEWSKADLQDEDKLTIAAMLPGCLSVIPASDRQDRAGVDWIATLRKGAMVLIDCKTRTFGCARHWQDGQPDMALETWSVRPFGKFNTPRHLAKVGWALCETKNVDYILFKFDPRDTQAVYLLPYQSLRIAFRRNLAQWKKDYKVDVQTTETTQYRQGWQSEAVFVPATVVIRAMEQCYSGTLVRPDCSVQSSSSSAA